jgi:predicted enzyme related to lactoylglutathione lyase
MKEFFGIDPSDVQGDNYVSFKFDNGICLGIKKATKEREIPGAQTVILETDDIVELEKKMREKGCTFYKELQTYSWGKSFDILDPDGNKIEFLEELHD